MPGVSCIVVVFHHETVGELLGALASEPVGEVLLVDNGHDPGLEVLAGASEVPARVLRPGTNLGYVGGCNLGAAEAAGEWLLFLNPDAIPEPGLVAGLLAAADDATAIVGAQVLLGDGEWVNAGDNPLHVSGLSWAGRYLEPREHGPERDVAVASGACLMVRAGDFARLGGYHPGYFLYHDDVDLAWRARLAGRRVLFAPDAAVRHDYDFAKGAYKWFWLERNRLWTVLSDYEARTLVLLAPVLLATELAILAFAVRSGWWREKLRSWRALWRARRELRAWRGRVQAMRRVGDAELLEAMTGRLETPLLAAPGLAPAGAAMEAYRRALVRLLRLLG